MRYYQADLLDFYRGTMTARRLLTLVQHLPSDSATANAIRGNDWTRAEHLLAGAFDVLQAANWQRSSVGRKSPPARPKPLARPGVHDERKVHRGEVLPIAEVRRRHAKYRPVPSTGGDDGA